MTTTMKSFAFPTATAVTCCSCPPSVRCRCRSTPTSTADEEGEIIIYDPRNSSRRTTALEGEDDRPCATVFFARVSDPVVCQLRSYMSESSVFHEEISPELGRKLLLLIELCEVAILRGSFCKAAIYDLHGCHCSSCRPEACSMGFNSDSVFLLFSY